MNDNYKELDELDELENDILVDIENEIQEKPIKHKYKKSTINRALSLNRECELNCERRTVDVIKEFGLQLDINKYCQSANSYILCYNFVKKVRTWDFKGSIYAKEIVDEMPTDLYTLNYNRLPRYYEALFRKVLMGM